MHCPIFFMNIIIFILTKIQKKPIFEVTKTKLEDYENQILYSGRLT